MLIGYARVSTQEQDTALQLGALKAVGVVRIYEEKASGARFDRPVLWECLASLGAGDQFVFYKLDRVARSLSDLLRILDTIERAGASIRSLTEPIESGTPAGRLMLQILGSMAEFERSLIRERSMAGQREAQARGLLVFSQFLRGLSLAAAYLASPLVLSGFLLLLLLYRQVL